MPFDLYSLNSPGLRVLGSSPFANPYYGPTQPGVSQDLFRATGKNLQYSNQSLPRPTAGTPGLNFLNTGNVAGAIDYNSAKSTAARKTTPSISGGSVKGTTNLSGDYAEALKRAQAEGRFEGMSDSERAAQQLAYEAQKTTSTENIDKIYSPTFNLYNELENLYSDKRAGLGDYYQGQFAGQYTDLANSRQNLLAENEADVNAQKFQEQSLLNEARQRYSQLANRNQTLYGGSTSTGGAANQLLGQEQLRGMNRINTDTGTALTQLRQQATEIEQQYVSTKQQIDSALQSALQGAQDEFDNKIYQIKANRAATESEKANANYEALQMLNQQATEIQNQYKQLTQQLGANALSAQQQLYAQQQNYTAQTGGMADFQNIPGIEYTQYLPVPSYYSEGTTTPSLLQRRRLEEQAA